MNFNFNISRIFTLGIAFFFETLHIHAQSTKVFVKCINVADGTAIKNLSLKAISNPGNSIILPIKDQSSVYFLINKIEAYKIIAESPGFYTEETSLSADQIEEETNLEIKMNPKPIGTALISVIDAATKEKISSNLDIQFKNAHFNFKTDPNTPEIVFDYEINGDYQLEANAVGYFSKKQNITLSLKTINIPEKITISLDKKPTFQTIQFYDEASKQPLKEVDLEVIDAKTKKKIPTQKTDNETFQWEAFVDEKYILNAKADGFREINQSIAFSSTVIKMGFSKPKPIQIQIMDSDTQKPIKTSFEIITPNRNKEKYNSSEKEPLAYLAMEVGKYEISTFSDDYLNQSGSFNIKSLTETSPDFILKLKKRGAEYEINVFDNETKAPLPLANVKIFNNNSSVLESERVGNKTKVWISETKKYFFEVTAADYFDYTANISFDQSIQVFLRKKPTETFQTFKFEILDAIDQTKVKNAKISFLLDAPNPRVLNILEPNSEGFIEEKLDLAKKYFLEVEARGYQPIRDLKIDKSKTSLRILLHPNQVSTVEFKCSITAFCRAKRNKT
jgi:hypothetical protein